MICGGAMVWFVMVPFCTNVPRVMGSVLTMKLWEDACTGDRVSYAGQLVRVDVDATHRGHGKEQGAIFDLV